MAATATVTGMADGHRAGLSGKTGQEILPYKSFTMELDTKKIPVGPNWLRLDPSHNKEQYLLFAASRISRGRVTYDSQSFQIWHENQVLKHGVQHISAGYT